MPLVLHMHGVSRTFDSPSGPVSILKDVSLKVLSGSAIAIRGPSGCGKSTLLYLAGTLDKPTSGLIEILGENPWRMSSSRLASFRNQHIGFIFQDHQLLPQCSVLENVLLPTLAGFDSEANIRGRAEAFRARPLVAIGDWIESGWPIACISVRENCLVGNVSEWPSAARYCKSLLSCWRTNQREIWIRRRRKRSARCCSKWPPSTTPPCCA